MNVYPIGRMKKTLAHGNASVDDLEPFDVPNRYPVGYLTDPQGGPRCTSSAAVLGAQIPPVLQGCCDVRKATAYTASPNN